jgi:hypothetical protein
VKEPRRLLECRDGLDGLERELLRSACVDVPSLAGRRRTARALGIATAGAVAAGLGGSTATAAASTSSTPLVSVGSSAGSAASSTAASSAGAATLKAGVAVALLKWVGVGVVGGAVAVSAIQHAVPRRSPKAASHAAPAACVQRPEEALEARPALLVLPNPVESPGENAGELAAPVTAPAKPPNPSSTPARTTTARPMASTEAAAPPSAPLSIARQSFTPRTLAEETAALDAARRALGAGDAAAALSALDGHDRDFPTGLLAPEATVLRIEALAEHADDNRALTAARAFLAAHPASPHARHVRSIVEGILAKSLSR